MNKISRAREAKDKAEKEIKKLTGSSGFSSTKWNLLKIDATIICSSSDARLRPTQALGIGSAIKIGIGSKRQQQRTSARPKTG
jgi:hypothetical protein